MAYVPPKDRVLEYSTSNSQTVFAVSGAADLSHNRFSASMSVGDTTIGGVVEPGVAFRSGILTYSATNQITVSITSESKGTFSASGIKQVFMGEPALLSNRIPDGSVSAPALSFLSDSDTGIYLIGANNIGVACGGSKIIDIAAAAVAILTTLSIAPAAASLNSGLSITQSSPASGSSTGPLNYNSISVTNTYNTTGASLVSGVDGTYITALKVDFYNHGSNLGSSSLTGIWSQMHMTTAAINGGSDKNAIIGSIYGNIADTGGGGWTGVVGSVAVDTGGSKNLVMGGEFDTGLAPGVTVGARYGMRVLNYGSTQATGNDAAFSVANLGSGAAGIPASTGGAYKNLILISNEGTLYPIAQTGSLLTADAAFTFANVINLPTATITGNVLSFPNFTMNPNGILTTNISVNSAQVHNINNASTGTGAISGYVAGVSGGASATFGMGGSGYTGLSIMQNRAFVYGNTNTSGVVIDTAGASPIIFATSDTERARVTPSGGLAVGLTTDTTVGVVNALTGFRVNSTATSGNVLRGNGTNFVSSTLAASDLSGLGTGVATALGINIGSAGALVLFNGALGTPSSGTVTNLTGTASININGTVGATTPTTGAFTTATASTSMTSPIRYGGSAANSTLTLASTSGAGTTDATIFQTGSQVEAGRINTSQQWNLGPNVAINSGTKLTVNNNTLAVNNGGLTGVTMQVASAVNTINRVELASAGTVPISVINFVSMAGTMAAPTATQAGTIGAFGAFGYGTTTFVSGGGGGILFNATQNWTDTAAGTAIVFITTPNGTATAVTALTVQNSGGVSVGTASDPGANNISAAVYKSPTAPTAVSGGGPIAIGSASTIAARMKVNLNGTDYWIPCSTSAF